LPPLLATYYSSQLHNITPHGAFHYSRVPPQKAQARRFAAPCGALGHCAFGSPPAVGALPRVGCRCCLRLRWGCSLWLLVLLVGARSRLRSSFLLFGLVFAVGFFAFLLVVPPLVCFGGSGALVVRGVAFRLLAPLRGFAFGFVLPRRWVFLALAPFAGLLRAPVVFRSCPASGVEGAPLRGCASRLRGGGLHRSQGLRLGAVLMHFSIEKTPRYACLHFARPTLRP